MIDTLAIVLGFVGTIYTLLKGTVKVTNSVHDAKDEIKKEIREEVSTKIRTKINEYDKTNIAPIRLMQKKQNLAINKIFKRVKKNKEDISIDNIIADGD